jgi:hypothetical protein
MQVTRAATFVLALSAPLALTAACGARTGLFFFPGEDSGVVASEDASADVSPDVPLIDDVVLPGLDSQPFDVVRQVACADASDTLIYTVTTDTSPDGQNNFRLLRFDPSTSQFTLIGTLACPDQGQPFSMAVDRTGAAYVLYYNEVLEGEGVVPPPGNIYRVDLNTAACEATSYVPSTQFLNFGMAFAANDDGGGETLYVASNNNDTSTSGYLGAIDEATLALTYVGTFSPTVTQAELTGTGDGRLFAFWAPNSSTSPGSAVSQINQNTAAVIAQAALPTVTQGGGWAFAFWGGQFYLFTNPDGPVNGDTTTIVQRYDPTTGAVVQVASYPDTVVGAGVSTCAPVQ